MYRICWVMNNFVNELQILETSIVTKVVTRMTSHALVRFPIHKMGSH